MPSLKLTGHYLAMATLAFGQIVSIFFIAAIDITGGPSGIGQIPYLNIFGFVLGTDLRFYYFIWISRIFIHIQFQTFFKHMAHNFYSIYKDSKYLERWWLFDDRPRA